MQSDTPLEHPATPTDTPAEPSLGALAGEQAGTDTPEREALRERMRKMAQRPRPNRRIVREGSPAWLRRLMDGVDSLRDHVLLKRYERELRAELKDAKQAPSSAIIALAIRQRALMEMVDAAAFSEQGGPVHRRRRELHSYVQQRAELVAGWMQLRRQMGLDPESVQPQSDAIDAFGRRLTQSFDLADQMAQARERVARLEEQRAKDREAETQQRILEALRVHGIETPAALLPPPSPAALDEQAIEAAAEAEVREQRPDLFEPIPSAELSRADLDAIREAFADAAVEMDSQLRPEGASVPHVSPTPAPPLELEPESETVSPETIVEDLGYMRAAVTAPQPAPPVRDWQAVERAERQMGTVINGQWCPSPWSLK